MDRKEFRRLLVTRLLVPAWSVIAFAGCNGDGSALTSSFTPPADPPQTQPPPSPPPAAGVCPIPRGRVEVQNNTVVADNGALLRGAHGNATNHVYKDLSWWEDLRDTYKLNVVRLDTRITKPHDSNDVEDLVNMNNLFANVDDAVDTAELAGMYIIIDNHTSCCLKYNPELVRRFWEMAAPRYKDRTHVMYELQNEPVTGNKGFEDVDIQFQEEMYHFIRQRAPDTHIILWSFAKITNTSKSAVDRAPGIDYSNASVGAHPYGHLTRDIGFEHLSELRSSYPVLISEFTILKETDPAQVWNYAEDQELSWVYLDRRDGGNHGDGVADPEEWPLNWPGDPACP